MALIRHLHLRLSQKASNLLGMPSHPTSRSVFRQLAIFAFVSCACGLVYYWYWPSLPMSTGTISNAICYAKDWDHFTATPHRSDSEDYTVYTPDAASIQDLFKGFSVQPQLWGVFRIPEETSALSGNASSGVGANRTHPAEFPVEGRPGGSRADDVRDFVAISGSFRQSRLLERYKFDCVVGLTTNIPPGLQRKTIKYTGRLDFCGTVPGNLVVFAKPIDEGLVHLVVVDVQ